MRFQTLHMRLLQQKKPELLKISHNFMYMDRHTLESIYFTYLQSFQSTKLL